MASDEELLKALDSAPEVSDSDLVAALDSAPTVPAEGAEEGASPGLLGSLANPRQAIGKLIAENTAIKDKDNKYTKFGSFVEGVKEAAPLYLTDEAIGAVNAARESELLGGQDKVEDFGKRYKAERDIVRDEFKKAKDQNEYSHLAGEVIGNILPALTPIGPAALGAKLLGTSVAKGILPKLLGKTGASVASAIGPAAFEGGAGALGASEAENLPDLATDAALGTTLAGAAGSILPAAKAAMSKLSEYTAPSKAIRAFQIGREGINLNKRSAVEEIRRNFGAQANELLDAIENKVDSLYDQKTGLLRAESKKIDFKKELEDLRDSVLAKKKARQISPAEAEELEAFIKEQEYLELPKIEKNAASLKTTKVTKEGKDGKFSTNTTTTTSAKGKSPEELPEVLEELLADPNKKIASSVSEGPGIRKESTTEVMDRIKEGVLNGEMSMEEAANQVRQWQRTYRARMKDSPGVAGTFAELATTTAEKIAKENPHLPIAELNKKINAALTAQELLGGKPKFLKPIGENMVDTAALEDISKLADPADFTKSKLEQAKKLFDVADKETSTKAFDKMQKISEDYDIARTISGEVAGAGGGPAKALTGISLRQLGLAGANIAGLASNVDKTMLGKGFGGAVYGAGRALRNQAVKGSSSNDDATISDADTQFSNDELNHYATQLATSNDKHDQNLAGELSLAQSQESPRTKRAMMWKIMQNPVYRQRLKGLRSAE